MPVTALHLYTSGMSRDLLRMTFSCLSKVCRCQDFVTRVFHICRLWDLISLTIYLPMTHEVNPHLAIVNSAAIIMLVMASLAHCRHRSPGGITAFYGAEGLVF